MTVLSDDAAALTRRRLRGIGDDAPPWLRQVTLPPRRIIRDAASDGMMTT